MFQSMDLVYFNWHWSGIFPTTCFSTRLGETVPTYRSSTLPGPRSSQTSASSVSSTQVYYPSSPICCIALLFPQTRNRYFSSAGTENGQLDLKRGKFRYYLLLLFRLGNIKEWGFHFPFSTEFLSLSFGHPNFWIWNFQCRSMRAFPHPHFDKQIPDQQEPQPRGAKNTNRWPKSRKVKGQHGFNLFSLLYSTLIANCNNVLQNNSKKTFTDDQTIFSGNFLYLKRSFHDGLRSDTGDTGDWERLPIAHSLQKLRLENTKVFKFNKSPTES